MTNVPVRLMAASGQLGYGIPQAAFEAGLAERPDMIGADMGSIDPGPHYLGSGQMAAGASGIIHDLRLLLSGGVQCGAPVLIGNAGTAGRVAQVDTVMQLVRHVLEEQHRSALVARLDTEVDRQLVLDRLAAGRVKPMPNVPPLSPDVVESAEAIVAQIGPERWVEALRPDPDIVLAGRSLDTAIFSAFALRHGIDRGLATHAAKIIECTSLAAIPPGRDAAIAVLDDDHFEYHSCGMDRVSTPRSVAAHAFYEQGDPSRISEPGGHVDLTRASYVPVDERTVRVSGSAWVADPSCWLKLEGARRTGWRAICVAGVMDPLVLRQRQAIEAEVYRAVERIAGGRDGTWRCRLTWGGGGSEHHDGAYRGMVLVEVIAASEDGAHSLCGAAKQYLLHAPYPGLLNNGGNVAFPFSPEVVSAGPSYEFSIYHLMEVDDPSEIGSVSVEVVDAGRDKEATPSTVGGPSERPR